MLMNDSVSFAYMASIREYWKSLNGKKKIYRISAVVLMVIGYGSFGNGYLIATQSLAIIRGCGMWSENTPSNWDVDDDWESFEPWPDAEERVDIRRNFDVSSYQMSSYENVSFTPRGDAGVTLRGWYVEVDQNAPVVILTHGMPMNGKCKPEMLLMQAYLSEGGINTLSFDLRNYGESDVVGLSLIHI